MASKSQPLKFKQVVDAPPAEVYRAFTNATALREWFCNAAQADAHKGGRFYAWWNSGYFAVGEYTALTPGKKVAFTWHGRGEPEPTAVQVSLAGKNGGTAVTVAHAGVGSGKKWAHAREEIERGWERGLANLRSVLETGMDERYTRRPMLGINVGDFNPEVADRLGVPVNEGLRLDAVLDGMGAKAAGLQKDDVIVKLGGVKISGWSSLPNALGRHRAGDQVEVVFYRGAEKKTVAMQLSPRPLPDIPPTPDGLAEALQRIYAQVIPELEQCFEGVSEAEASYRPGPGEWSAKETVAHLITGERDGHFWITGIATGEEPETFPNNFTPRNSAVVAVYSTVPELLEEFKRCAAETVALLAALPPEFVQRKGSYWRIGHNALQPDQHARDHFKQIREAIAAARANH